MSSLTLAGSRRVVLQREEVYFSAVRQKSTKRTYQRGRTYGSPPLDIPHSRHGLVVEGSGLIARTVPASRLSVTHALSPLGLAEGVLKAFVLNL